MTVADSLLHHLSARLAEPLPGSAAHRLMIPNDPAMTIRLNPAPPTAKRSAVVVPLIERSNTLPDVLLTVRSAGLRSHGGQISLPGGRIEDGESNTVAALRELEEETGINSADVTVLGELTTVYIPPSNNVVAPIVAIVREPVAYKPSEAEVHEIFTVSIADLLDTSTHAFIEREVAGRTVQWPVWNVHPAVPLWGATAMILSELVWIFREKYDT